MRVRAKYRIKGRDIRVTWVPFRNKRLLKADADWAAKELRLDKRLKLKKYEDDLQKLLVHELLHLLWWNDHKDEDHPVWEIRHGDFARYFWKIDQLLRSGTDGT